MDEDDGIPPYIEILRGRDGRDGRDGIPGLRGFPGIDGPIGIGMPGPQGPPGANCCGVTYVRWGRTICPNTPGTELVYTGRAAGSYYKLVEVVTINVLLLNQKTLHMVRVL